MKKLNFVASVEDEFLKVAMDKGWVVTSGLTDKEIYELWYDPKLTKEMKDTINEKFFNSKMPMDGMLSPINAIKASPHGAQIVYSLKKYLGMPIDVVEKAVKPVAKPVSKQVQKPVQQKQLSIEEILGEPEPQKPGFKGMKGIEETVKPIQQEKSPFAQPVQTSTQPQKWTWTAGQKSLLEQTKREMAINEEPTDDTSVLARAKMMHPEVFQERKQPFHGTLADDTYVSEANDSNTNLNNKEASMLTPYQKSVVQTIMQRYNLNEQDALERAKVLFPKAFAQWAEDTSYLPKGQEILKEVEEKMKAKEEELKKKEQEKSVAPKTAAIINDLVKLANELEDLGEIQAAAEVDEQIKIYKEAVDKLYDVTGEKGEDLINSAHPGKSPVIAPAKEDGGKVENVVEQQEADLKVISKDPTGKIAELVQKMVVTANKLEEEGRLREALLVDKKIEKLVGKSCPFVGKGSAIKMADLRQDWESRINYLLEEIKKLNISLKNNKDSYIAKHNKQDYIDAFGNLRSWSNSLIEIKGTIFRFTQSDADTLKMVEYGVENLKNKVKELITEQPKETHLGLAQKDVNNLRETIKKTLEELSNKFNTKEEEVSKILGGRSNIFKIEKSLKSLSNKTDEQLAEKAKSWNDWIWNKVYTPLTKVASLSKRAEEAPPGMSVPTEKKTVAPKVAPKTTTKVVRPKIRESIKSFQQALKNYNPETDLGAGGIDGIWGKFTAGSWAYFVNDLEKTFKQNFGLPKDVSITKSPTDAQALKAAEILKRLSAIQSKKEKAISFMSGNYEFNTNDFTSKDKFTDALIRNEIISAEQEQTLDHAGFNALLSGNIAEILKNIKASEEELIVKHGEKVYNSLIRLISNLSNFLTQEAQLKVQKEKEQKQLALSKMLQEQVDGLIFDNYNFAQIKELLVKNYREGAITMDDLKLMLQYAQQKLSGSSVVAKEPNQKTETALGKITGQEEELTRESVKRNFDEIRRFLSQKSTYENPDVVEKMLGHNVESIRSHFRKLDSEFKKYYGWLSKNKYALTQGGLGNKVEELEVLFNEFATTLRDAEYNLIERIRRAGQIR